MYDAREPLFQHDVVLTGDDDITIWNNGEEQETFTPEGLKALGEQFEQGNLPDWYTGKANNWDFATTGKVLKVLAEKSIEVGTEKALATFYGGSIFGPANPDIQRAGLTIDENNDLNWR